MIPRETDPLDALDEMFGAAADAVGAERPGSVASSLSGEDRRALSDLLRLVGELGLDHTLNRDGKVLVPIESGDRILALEPCLVAGEPWISL